MKPIKTVRSKRLLSSMSAVSVSTPSIARIESNSTSGQIASLRAELEALTATVATLSGTVSALSSTVSTLSATVSALSDEMESEFVAVREEIEALRPFPSSMSAKDRAIALLRHAAAFSKIENDALVNDQRGWFADEPELGDKAWSPISLMEHYTSTLHPIPELRTGPELQVISLMQPYVNTSIDNLDDALGTERQVSLNLNAELDAMVEAIILQITEDGE